MKKSIIKDLKRELDFLYRIAQSVHSLELNELLDEIVNITDELTHADSCLIYILDSKKNELVLRASKNPHSSLIKRITLKVGEGITGWVAREGKVVAIGKDASKDPRFKIVASLPEDKFEAFLSVPIVNKKGITGVINIQYKKVHDHSSMEINLMTAIGKLVGGAVENAILIEESLELKEALELRKALDRAKGILMSRKKISEKEAYRIMQKESMNLGKSLKDIAEAIILVEHLQLGS